MIAPINFRTTGMQERNRVAGQFIDEPFFNISAAKNIFGSTDRLDEKQKYLDYLKNDEKLRERGILPPRKMAFGGFDPNNFESAFSIAQTPRGDSTPIYFDDHMKQYVPRPFGPQQFPEYMQAGGPELFPIKKEPSGRVIKGTRKGVRTFEENDLRNQQGIIKASMDFLNQFNV